MIVLLGYCYDEEQDVKFWIEEKDAQTAIVDTAQDLVVLLAFPS